MGHVLNGRFNKPAHVACDDELIAIGRGCFKPLDLCVNGFSDFERVASGLPANLERDARSPVELSIASFVLKAVLDARHIADQRWRTTIAKRHHKIRELARRLRF